MQTQLSRYIARKINQLRGSKSQREIARELGYVNANIVSMFKRGETKVPLVKVLLLARAIEGDAAHMFRLALQQYEPDVLPVVDAIFGRLVSDEEFRVITLLRERAPDGLVRLTWMESIWDVYEAERGATP